MTSRKTKTRTKTKAKTAKAELPEEATSAMGQSSAPGVAARGRQANVAAALPNVTAPPARPTKLALVQQMLVAPGGATMAALVEATGWQPHTMRAALTRLRQAGHRVERERTEAGETVYHISATKTGEPASAAPSAEVAS